MVVTNPRLRVRTDSYRCTTFSCPARWGCVNFSTVHPVSIAVFLGMNFKQTFSLLAGLLALSLAGIACGANLFSVQDDVSLGRDIDAEIRRNPKEYPILDNERVRGYLQDVVNSITTSPNVKYSGTFPYKVTLLNDDRTVNAFATPGGYIYVYTGLLRFCENEAMLAGVLAHEIAHSEERHGTEHMTQSLGLGVVLSIISGESNSELVNIAASSATLLATLANSRSDELEADTKGFSYLKSTKWWPGGIKLFFEKMLIEQGRGTSVFEEWISSHPAPEDRVDNINKLLRENMTPAPSPNTLMTSSYRTMLRNLR